MEVRELTGAEPQLTLVDLDRTSLRLAHRYAEVAGLQGVRTWHQNVLGHRSALPARGRHAGRRSAYDVVEAIGLLEYLGREDWVYRYDRVIASRSPLAGAVTFLRNAYDLVAPGGMLIVGNMLTTHPQLGFTLNVVQWPHIQPHSVETMLEIIAAAGIDAQLQVRLPQDGVYALYVVQRPPDDEHVRTAGRGVRVDA